MEASLFRRAAPQSKPCANPAAVQEAIDRAAGLIAPVWPLQSFVAVNPFLGLIDRPFHKAADALAHAAGARMTLDRAFYAGKLDDGTITDADLRAALDDAPPDWTGPTTPAALRAAASAPSNAARTQPKPTVLDVADGVTGTDWSRLMIDCVSAWAAEMADAGQAAWPAPWRTQGLYAAWRRRSMLDSTPEIAGLRGFRARVAALPDDPDIAAHSLLTQLGIPQDGLDTYLHRCAMSVGGWAAWARQRDWQANLDGTPAPRSVQQIITIRLAWDCLVRDCLDNQSVAQTWANVRSDLNADAASGDETAARDRAVDIRLHAAFEKARQRILIADLGTACMPPAEANRPAIQAAFCIDVRSEVFRRALESVDDEIETLGFAGFFGIPFSYVPLGATEGGAHCPVLLAPQYSIREAILAGDAKAALSRLAVRQRIARAWRRFRSGSVSAFAFVETLGLGFAPRLLGDMLGLSRPVSDPAGRAVAGAATGPTLNPAPGTADRAGGIPEDDRIAIADAVLNAMSLPAPYARLVVLAGHGASTVNNPHATGLDCGACGGHTGEANARVAAAILNDPAVRRALADRGTVIPDDTVFVAALHDTTEDRVTVFDRDALPETHDPDLARLDRQLAEAGRRTRAERARLLGPAAMANPDWAVPKRGHDWSQVRPEWGLAGCAAFIAAPRHRTAGHDLDGRAFLHSYDWRQDEDFSVLSLIMTAPMVVASWISLQYYGSTVDNTVFGSGNKVLHNVVAGQGVLEGQGGDLRVGLPWQSVHDGERLIHEPLRLSVILEAPVEAINAIIAQNADVRHLVDNGWLHLFAMDDAGRVAHRYTGNQTWADLPTDRAQAALSAA